MKKNVFLRIGALMLIAVLATSGVFVGSGTYAKYVTSGDVSASAKVAKFCISVNGSDITHGGTIADIELSGDLYEDDGTVQTSLTSATASGPLGGSSGLKENAGGVTHVTSGFIAPGTGGKFELKVFNNSDVRVRYRFSGTATIPNNVISNIAFSADNNTWRSTLQLALEDITGASTGWKELAIGDTDTYSDVCWRWAFTVNDTNDTAIGIAAKTADQKLTIPVLVEIQQVD